MNEPATESEDEEEKPEETPDEAIFYECDDDYRSF